MTTLKSVKPATRNAKSEAVMPTRRDLKPSPALSILRNGPKMVKDMRSWRENVREQSLRNFHHKAEWQSALPAEAMAGQMAQRLGHAGYQAKVVAKEGGLLVAAKRELDPDGLMNPGLWFED